jgi:hypothetical protein
MPRKSADHSAIVAVGKLCCISTISLSRAEPRKAVKAPRAKARLRKNHSKQPSESQLFKTVALLWQSSAKALNKPERALIRRSRASTHEPQSDTKFVRCIELLFQSSTSSLYKPERVKKGKSNKAAKKRDDIALRQTVVQLFSYSSKELSRSEAKPKVAKVRPDYQSGRCVFCGRKSKRLLLPEGRELRGYHCPKCTVKMQAMTEERLAVLDLAMTRLREAAKQRKELARQKREENARKNASKTPWRTSKYDDDVELEDLGEQGFSWDRDKRYRTDDDF